MSDTNNRVKNLTISNVLGEGFNLFFHNIKTISAPAFFYSLIFTVVVYIPMIILFMNIDQLENMDNMDNVPAFVFFMIVFIIIYVLIIVITFASTILLSIVQTIRSSEVYLKKEIRPILEVIKGERKIFLPFLALFILLGTLITIGMYLFIIPGVFLSLALLITIPIFILEKKSIIDSMKRSWTLTKGKRIDLFIIQLIYTFLLQAISGVIMIVPLAVVGIAMSTMGVALTEILDDPDIISTLYPIFFTAAMIPSILLTTISTSLTYGFTTAVYYNILKDSEGFATEHLAESFLADSSDQSKTKEEK